MMAMRTFLWLCACLAALAPAGLHGQQSEATVPDGTYELFTVEVRPRLRNLQDVLRDIAALYPPDLRDAKVEGEVVLRYTIDESGRVDTTTIQVVSTTDARFDAAATQIAGRML